MAYTALPEPPTKSSLSDARQVLQQSLLDLDVLSSKIVNAEADLQQTILAAQRAIDDMRKEKAALEGQVSHTRFYLAPMRMLPLEILSDVYYRCFEEDPCIAWVLAAVCRNWRTLALAMPLLWSKVRLRTTHSSSPDTVRLWIERSGPSVPLDIEISVRGAKSLATFANPSRPIRQILPAFRPPSPPTPLFMGHGSVFYGQLPPPPHLVDGSSRGLVYDGDIELDNEHGATVASRNRLHWAHIVFSYLVEQIHRWERFVFRFDTHFPSIGALKTIFGDAPLLKEFEISSASEANYPHDWTWLPNLDLAETKALSGITYSLPQLRSLTLQLAPFRSTSPLFHTGLHSLNLYSLSHAPASLDRILHVLRVNQASLQSASLHFRDVSRAIIPLSHLTMPNLVELSIGGNQILSDLIDALSLPSLEELNLDLYGPSLQQTISGLINRSGGNAMPVKHLSIGYGFGCGYRAAKSNRFVPHVVNDPFGQFGGRSSHLLGAWRNILEDLVQLESLRVGEESSSHLFDALVPPEQNHSLHLPPTILIPIGPGAGANLGWLCPNLVELGIRGFNLQAQTATELVRTVETRNPPGAGQGAIINGVSPKRLNLLELHECSNVRQEVKEWFQTRVKEVAITEPFQITRLNSLHSFA